MAAVFGDPAACMIAMLCMAMLFPEVLSELEVNNNTLTTSAFPSTLEKPKDCRSWKDWQCREPSLRNHPDFLISCARDGWEYYSCAKACERNRVFSSCANYCEDYLDKCLEKFTSTQKESRTDNISIGTTVISNQTSPSPNSSQMATADESLNTTPSFVTKLSPPLTSPHLNSVTGCSRDTAGPFTHMPSILVPFFGSLSAILMLVVVLFLAIGFDLQIFKKRILLIWQSCCIITRNGIVGGNWMALVCCIYCVKVSSNGNENSMKAGGDRCNDHGGPIDSGENMADTDIEMGAKSWNNSQLSTENSDITSLVPAAQGLAILVTVLLDRLGKEKDLAEFKKMVLTFLKYMRDQIRSNPEYWNAVKQTVLLRQQAYKGSTLQPKLLRQISHQSGDGDFTTPNSENGKVEAEDHHEEAGWASEEGAQNSPLLAIGPAAATHIGKFEKDLMVYEIKLIAERYYHHDSRDFK